MLKIPQARLQQYMNHELQDIRLDLEGQRNQRSNCQHPLDHRKSKRVPASTSASLTMPKPLTVWITTHWKILIEMGIPDHLTCLLRNLYAGQEATVRTGYGTTYWFQIGKGVCQGCILSLCIFNLYAEYIMRNVGLDEAQAGIKIASRNINNLRYADDTTLGRKCRRTKELLEESERGDEKVGLKLNIQKTKIMAFGPITSWQIGKQWKP